MEWKRTIPLFVKLMVISIFGGLLGFWSIAAFKKYIDQPVATYVTYTQGDDNVNIVYPLVTFCGYDYYSANDFESCRNTSDSFFDILMSCLESPDFDLEKYLAKLEAEFIGDTDLVNRFTYGQDEFNSSLQLVLDYDVGNNGVCLNFDPSRLGGFFVDRGKDKAVANVEIQFKALFAILHTEDDFPDALEIHVGYQFKVKDEKVKHKELWLKKKIIRRESTQNSPCGKMNKKTCQEVKTYQEIADRFKCKNPILYSGKHLDKYVQGFNELPNCNQRQALESMKFFKSINFTKLEVECKYEVACTRVKWQIHHSSGSRHEGSSSRLQMTYGLDYEVEHYTTYISYDILSLIGELGGVIGMFLGFSGLSLGLTFADFLERLLYMYSSTL